MKIYLAGNMDGVKYEPSGQPNFDIVGSCGRVANYKENWRAFYLDHKLENIVFTCPRLSGCDHTGISAEGTIRDHMDQIYKSDMLIVYLDREGLTGTIVEAMYALRHQKEIVCVSPYIDGGYLWYHTCNCITEGEGSPYFNIVSVCKAGKNGTCIYSHDVCGHDDGYSTETGITGETYRNANCHCCHGSKVTTKHEYWYFLTYVRAIAHGSWALSCHDEALNHIIDAYGSEKDKENHMHYQNKIDGDVGLFTNHFHEKVFLHAGDDANIPKSITIQLVRRDMEIVNKLKSLYNGECQICGFTFQKEDGSMYSEACHLIPLGKKGSDAIHNMVILCPNHHKQLDLAETVLHTFKDNALEIEINEKTEIIKYKPEHFNIIKDLLEQNETPKTTNSTPATTKSDLSLFL